MAEKNCKVGEVIQVVYQAPGAASALVVTMEIYDESGAKDTTNFPDVVMVESGSSGRYIGSLTPDVEGEWRVDIYDALGGKVTKRFSVGSENISSLGSKFATTESNIRGGAGDTLETLSDQIDGVVTLGLPPMVS